MVFAAGGPSLGGSVTAMKLAMLGCEALVAVLCDAARSSRGAGLPSGPDPDLRLEPARPVVLRHATGTSMRSPLRLLAASLLLRPHPTSVRARGRAAWPRLTLVKLLPVRGGARLRARWPACGGRCWHRRVRRDRGSLRCPTSRRRREGARLPAGGYGVRGGATPTGSGLLAARRARPMLGLAAPRACCRDLSDLQLGLTAGFAAALAPDRPASR